MSDEKIDHAAEAERIAQLADLTYGRIEHRNGAGAVSEGVEAQMMAQVAQVHATLALVEQQRIANLMYYYKHLPGTTSWDASAHVREIRKGLGL